MTLYRKHTRALTFQNFSPGKGVVYVSLAPMSRAHTHHDPSRPSPSAAPASSAVAACDTAAKEGRAKDDGSWINTPARPGQRAPQNTPWRGGGGEATEASESPPVSQPSLVNPLDIVQDISIVSVGDSESTVGSVLRLAGRGLKSGVESNAALTSVLRLAGRG